MKCCKAGWTVEALQRKSSIPSSGVTLTGFTYDKLPSTLLHVLIDLRQHGVTQKWTEAISQLIGLRLDGSWLSVVSTIRGMGIHHHIRIPFREEAIKHRCGQTIAFNEVTVQIEVTTIGAEKNQIAQMPS